MPVVTENPRSPARASSQNTGRELRKTRKPNPENTSEADPNPESQTSSHSKNTISSLLKLSTFPSNEPSNSQLKKKGNSFTQSTLRGLGCAAVASQQVSVPAVIRTSAEWELKRVKKKQGKSKKKRGELGDGHNGFVGNESRNVLSSGVVQEVWCLPRVGFSPNAVGSVDCVVGRRNVSERGKLDCEKFSNTEHDCLPRRTVDETFPFIDSEPCPEMFQQRMMVQNSSPMREISESGDRFTRWRLDIDHMTYEQLVDLEDRIGYVSTGLKETEIIRSLRRIKQPMTSITAHIERKCTICQEDCEGNDEMGKLHCGHSFHFQCIKQWLVQKNSCPVCKISAMATFGSA